MKIRNNPQLSNILFVITGVLLALTGILRIVLHWLQYRDGIGIIGGADTPTVMLWLKTAGWRVILQILIGIVCIVTSAIRLKRKGNHEA